MLKALFYKEWLKIRWILLGGVIVFILVILNVAVTLNYYFRNAGYEQMYYYATIMQYIFYGDILKYVPLIAGIVLSVAQFLPEVNADRLKLTLHLPMNENKIVFFMLATGTAAILSLILLTIIILAALVLYYFPAQVLYSMFWTSAPWFLAGLVSYWATTLILIEQIWLRRAFYAIFSYFFISFLFINDEINLYQKSIWWFVMLSLIFAFAVLYSGWRYRKGVR